MNGLFKCADQNTKSTLSSPSMSNKLQSILYPDSYLTKKLESSSRRKIPSASYYCLAKYFPKFYRRLKISSEPNWRLLKGIKRVKTLHHLEMRMWIENSDDDKIEKFARHLRKPLQNKRKSMKSIPVVNNHQFLELGMLLPRITILNLLQRWKPSWIQPKNQLKGSREKVQRFYARLWMYFRHLEHVKVFEYDHDLYFMIQELNKHKTVFDSLKTFVVAFETFKDQDDSRDLQKEFTKSLSDQSSTHITLKEEGFTSFAPLLISLLLFCPKTQHFNIQIVNEQDNIAYMNILQKFDTLTVKTLDSELFVNQLEFLKASKKVSQAISHYERISRCRKAAHLRALELYSYNSFNEDFISSTLKEALSLESLVLRFSFKNIGRAPCQLTPALGALPHYKSLKHLTILDQSKEDYKKITFNLKLALEKMLPFSQLASLKIDCLVQEATSFKDFLQTFLGDLQEPKSVSFSRISFPSFQSLTEFFQALNNHRSLTEDNASFKVHLPVNRIKDMLRDFDSPLILEKGIPVDLAIDSRADSIVPSDLSPKIMELFQTIFPQFKVTNKPPSDLFLLKN